MIAYNCMGLNIIMGLEPGWCGSPGLRMAIVTHWSMVPPEGGQCCIMTLQCTQASQTLITQSNNMNNLSAAAATDQIFAPRPGSLVFVWLQQSILCFSESSSGWPWGCVIFWLLASDLRMLENCSNSLRPHKMWVATKNQSRLEFWLKYWPQMTGAECG